MRSELSQQSESSAPVDAQGRKVEDWTLRLLRMESAPRDGTSFTYVQLVTVVGVGMKPRCEAFAQRMRRVRTSADSAGYWATDATSVPDHTADYGFWIPMWGVAAEKLDDIAKVGQ